MNTRHTKIFIGAMMLIGLGTATYAGFASHTPNAYLAMGVLALAAATAQAGEWRAGFASPRCSYKMLALNF